jgi:hypothetical protein
LTEKLEQARRERKAAERRALGLEPEPDEATTPGDVPAAPGGLILLPAPTPEPGTADADSAGGNVFLDLRDPREPWPPADAGKTPSASRATTRGTWRRLHAVADVPPGDTQERCPTCYRVARSDMADLIHQTLHFSCDTCGTLWQKATTPASTL